MKDNVIPVQPSCASDVDPAALSADEASARIQAQLRPVAGFEQVPIRQALGRVLYRDVPATIDVPSHTNSAMDGYALAGTDLPADGTASLRVVGTALAGQAFTGQVKPGESVRIMTGASMPAGTDTVVMQEQAERLDDTIRIDHRHRPGQNVRQAGEDLAVGQVAVARGKSMTPADVGLLASLGVPEVRVTRRLRVAFFSTGDELRSIGEHLGDGEVYDSNRYTLHGMLSRLGVQITDMGVIPDQRQAIRQAFTAAASASDVVITTGGVSVGEADYIKEILAEAGQVGFWKIAIKPGRPLAFGRLGEATFFGLPGNPVAVMVTFYQFVQPALRHLMGQTRTRPHRFAVPCAGPIRKRPGRTEYLRGILHTDPAGGLTVSPTGAQGSGVLSSMSHADCFIVLPPENAGVETGERVPVEPFDGIL